MVCVWKALYKWICLALNLLLLFALQSRHQQRPLLWDARLSEEEGLHSEGPVGPPAPDWGKLAWTRGRVQTFTCRLERSLAQLFLIIFHQTSPFKKNAASCSTAARLVCCAAPFMRRYMNLRRDRDTWWQTHSVCPSSCRVKDMSAFLMRLRVFEKKKKKYFRMLLYFTFSFLLKRHLQLSSLFAHCRCLWWLEVKSQLWWSYKLEKINCLPQQNYGPDFQCYYFF